MLELPQKMRVIGIVAATTGLRISEVVGLKWMNIHRKTLQMDVTRSVVDGIVGKCKTETFRRPVPIDEFTTAELVAWNEKLATPSRRTGSSRANEFRAKCRPWADTLDRLPATGRKAGRNHKVGRISYLPAYLLNAAQIEWRRCQSGSGIDAPRKHLHNDEHLHEGSDFSQSARRKAGWSMFFWIVLGSAAEDAA